MQLNPIRLLLKQYRKYKYKCVQSEFMLSDDDIVQRKGELIEKEIFNGGPIDDFSVIGRLYLITLLKIGITPDSRVLDVGCGALRGGYWLIHFLNPNRYFGIEPNKKMLEVGKKILLKNEVLEHKKPQFDYNSNFNFAAFNQNFDFVVARSIWSHASKIHVQKMIDEFIANTTPKGILLASYKKPYFKKQDYNNNEWMGKSHDSDIAGIVHHSLSWIEKECNKRNLKVRELKFDYYNQIWLQINK